APGAGVSPASLTYGNQVIGTSSGGQTVIVNSTGTDPLTISSIALSGANPAEYSQTNNCPLSPAMLPAGQSCTIQVSFAPLAVGTRTANLVVTDNDSNVVGSQQSVSLTGTASAPAPTVTSVDVPFTPGTNVSNVATINCPSNTSPCTDPNAHSLKIQFSQVNTPFVMTVTAYEVPLSEANGVCAVGSNETTDFDCRFTQFFPIQNQANGDVIVPQCIPYSNGNCVFYRITNAPGASAYTGPVFENISWNNTAYLPPAFYQVNNPRAYDDPDYSPYDVNHQFALDITDFFNPIAQVGTDPTITMHTTRFSDFTIAWPGSLPNPGYTFTFQAPLNGTPSVTQGTTIPVAFSLTQSGTPIANALTPPNVVSLGLLNGQGTRLPALAPDGSAAAFVYNSQAQVYQLTLATQNLVPGTYTLLVSSNLFSQQVATFTITPVPLQIVTSSPLTSGTNGVLYPQAFTAIGGTAPYSWVISNGSLPNGVTLTTGGFLDGTPTATGTFTFTLQVTDAAQSSQSQVYSLTINPPALVSIAVTPANASITQ
ncbi:MAG TPA: choice-of-anchor D domain-containing protein, partial [Terriglobia bacterium]|nr:choice-of-anchor D domain-containing protein [Terriglobia bacterium]